MKYDGKQQNENKKQQRSMQRDVPGLVRLKQRYCQRLVGKW